MSGRDERIRIGSVVQITDMPPSHRGWVGAFLIVTELKSFGVQGFVQVIPTHDSFGQAYTRVRWDQIDYIGEAEMLPEGVVEKMEEPNDGVQGP